MKAFGYLSVLVLMIGMAFICLFYSTKDSTFTNLGASLTWQGNDLTATIKNRKLKEDNGYIPSLDEGNSGKVNLEDYRPIDPVPSSKARIRPAPIQHGTPLMPYIPNPAPPPSHSSPVGPP